MSEAREVNVRKSRIEWCPGMARQFHTVPGPSIPLIMGSNGLGFVTIRPLTDRHRIIRLLRRSALTPPWLLVQINRHGTVSVTAAPELTPVVTAAPELTPVVAAALSHTPVIDSDTTLFAQDIDAESVDASEQSLTFMPTSVLLDTPLHGPAQARR
jgi:hypothetical protein